MATKQAAPATAAAAPAPAPAAARDLSEATRQKIIDGFRINSMIMRNAENGQIVWESDKWDKTFEEEVRIDIPASILSLKAVSREMNFSSAECITNFRLVQSVSLKGQPLEEWRFNFGFVIPGSTNSWQCVIESAGEGQMIPASILSGHILIETRFYDGDAHVSTTRIRVFYQ